MAAAISFCGPRLVLVSAALTNGFLRTLTGESCGPGECSVFGNRDNLAEMVGAICEGS